LLQERHQLDFFFTWLHEVLNFPLALISLEATVAVAKVREVEHHIVIFFFLDDSGPFPIKLLNFFLAIANNRLLEIKSVLVVDCEHVLARFAELIENVTFGFVVKQIGLKIIDLFAIHNDWVSVSA